MEIYNNNVESNQEPPAAKPFGYFFGTIYAYHTGLCLLLFGILCYGGTIHNMLMTRLVWLLKLQLRLATAINESEWITWKIHGVIFMLFGLALLIGYWVIRLKNSK
jgi:hypothetical protein